MTIPAFWNESWTPALINHLWQSTIVAGIAWLLAISLHKYSARVRYWVWFAASIKFLLPFSLLITAGEWLRSWLPAQSAQPAVVSVVEQMAQPFAPAQVFDATAAPVAAHAVNWLPAVLLMIWTCGVLLVAVRFSRGWWTAYAAKRAALLLNLATDVPVLCSPARLSPESSVSSGLCCFSRMEFSNGSQKSNSLQSSRTKCAMSAVATISPMRST